MNITSIGSTATTMVAAARPSRGRGPDMTKALAPVADTLGMSVDDLKQALDGGATLNDIAASKGVSHSDLIAAIKQGIQATRPADAPAHADAAFDIDALAESIASGTPPPRPPDGAAGPAHHHHGVNKNDTAALDSVSSLLDISTDDLVSALMSGTTLTDLATTHGVDPSSVLNVLGQGMVVNTTM